jgi:hypothetical protein
MTVALTLEYKRVSSATGCAISTGRIMSKENGLVTEEASFSGLDFKQMIGQLAGVLLTWPDDHDIPITLQRTDREGLLPYELDKKTVELIRTDPVAAIQAMEFSNSSPSSTVRRVQRERVMMPAPPITVGYEALLESFGDVVYFKVRAHELECPGCGYWGMFISPGLLKDPERAGEVVKTAFVCPKLCRTRFIVTCQERLGYVDTEYLLKQTKLERFYFPRAWNEGRSWVSREALQQKYDAYLAEKEITT